MTFLNKESWGRRDHERRSEARTGKFRTGQSVLHRWAGWFASATEPPMQLNKKLRPGWFDATVVMALGVRPLTYAGRQWHEPCYQVSDWNAAGEVVPEPIIMRRPAGDDPRVLGAPSLLLSHSMPLHRVLGAAEPFDETTMSQPPSPPPPPPPPPSSSSSSFSSSPSSSSSSRPLRPPKPAI